MRINKFLALHTSLSRRAADTALEAGRVTVDGLPAPVGADITPDSIVKLDGSVVSHEETKTVAILNKPVGYVCSRNGQGSKTIYDLLPATYHHLNPVGRLDKNSSGLLLLTNDGDLAQQLTHPKYQKTKRYEVRLDTPIQPLHQQMITEYGVTLDDGKSQFIISRFESGPQTYEVLMSEGRNRQIRRTFEALGYTVTHLHRTHFGPYSLGSIAEGKLALTT